MTETDDSGVPEPPAVSPQLAELSARLSGRWRVTGPGIEGRAEYRSHHDGRLLVGLVTVDVEGTAMTNLQHLAHDPATGTVRARYLDSLGNDASYTWALDDRQLRVSLDGAEPDTYFAARFNDDFSEYAGRWYGLGDDDGRIVYSRIP